MCLCPQVPGRPAGVGCPTWGLRPWSLWVAKALTAGSSFPQAPPAFVGTDVSSDAAVHVAMCNDNCHESLYLECAGSQTWVPALLRGRLTYWAIPFIQNMFFVFLVLSMFHELWCFACICLSMGVKCHVGAGNWTWVLWKSSQYF